MKAQRGAARRPIPQALGTVSSGALSRCGNRMSQRPFPGKETILVNVDFGHASNMPFHGKIKTRGLLFRGFFPSCSLSLHAVGASPPRSLLGSGDFSFWPPRCAPIPLPSVEYSSNLLTAHPSSHTWASGYITTLSAHATSNLPLTALRLCYPNIIPGVQSAAEAH